MSLLAPVLSASAPVLPPDRVQDLLSRFGLQDSTVRALPGERDLNLLVADRYVLKVSNPAEDSGVVDMEVAALAHARQADPGLPLPQTVPGTSGRSVEEVNDASGRRCLVRLVTLLPGEALEGAALSVELAEQVGEAAGRTSAALQGFFHPAGGRVLDWDVRRLPEVLEAAGPAADQWLRDLAARVEPALREARSLPGGLQHADVTLTNVLAFEGQVSGVIDFGDMHHTAVVCDLAVTLASVLRTMAEAEDEELWERADAVLRGYQRHRTLSGAEAAVLGELVIARLVLTLLISACRVGDHPGNHAYITQYDRSSRALLDRLAAWDPDTLADRIATLTGTAHTGAWREGAATELLQRRTRSMGGRLSPLFYRQPLHMVRGQGPWLFTADGTRYLDAYNNVAVVGHAHPAVTTAVTGQMAALNTHSRYLHPGVVDLAERLLATMPEHLDTCLFTTSGTEANELAWRLAAHYTGGQSAVIAEHAYHGSSAWMAQWSSNEWPAGYRPEAVATFRAPHHDGAPLTAALARERVEAAAATLTARGLRPAVVAADTLFTSEGILEPTQEFMQGLVEGAHAAGALYLADEVQAGYGRSGQMWAFTRHGMAPDLVTLGKPMGAGYPIGALITRREIADRLAEDYEYFSTFAATPVAAAAGLAVLDLLEHTGMPQRAALVGEYLRGRVAALQAAHPALAAVRGHGLIAGIELSPTTGRDGRAFAEEVLAGLTERRVLAGLTGPHGTVLKVRPPLAWRTEHADLFVDALADTLASLTA
ncbi:aminotransferase class III-fold pyridoxal phosphate-dependent enzyme [Streptomyces sp. NPDC057257]|uniref:aminotransferase class III-fold pyridoxal phosphate-dependent enzyme n=1 Tax=Streptomyces sp. NPDC057257 TaxID=3346071 RepID=UPI00363DB246